MGVELVELERIPFRGYLLNCHDSNRGTGYIAPPAGAPHTGIEAIVYDGTMHAAAINSLYQQAAIHFPNPPASAS